MIIKKNTNGKIWTLEELAPPVLKHELYEEIKALYQGLAETDLSYFDGVYCICMADQPMKQKRLLKQLKHFYPSFEPTVFDAINTRHLKNHHIGCALSHRAIVQEAKDKKYKNVLVFEEDAILHKNFSTLLKKNIFELKTLDWDIFYLGACCWGEPKLFENIEGCKTIKKLKYGGTCTHGLAWNNSMYDYVLNELPDNIEEMKKWCEAQVAIDQWTAYTVQEKKNAVISNPRLCTQPFLPNAKHDEINDFNWINEVPEWFHH